MLQKKLPYHSLLLALLLLCTVAKTQKTVNTIGQAITDYSSNHLAEKLFVHTDKSFYMAGEILWFKMYATDAYRNQPLDLSKLSYVELLTKDHKPILQAKIALTDGTGNGSFQLPYSVNSGNFILRAYTNWMKNQGADFFFEKNITIVNALRKPEWPIADTSHNYDVQFFPEGGSLVNGLQSKIAFRIVDAEGRSLNVSGAIVNGRNDTVAHFSTLRFGMGHFDLQPSENDKYRAVIRINEETVITRLLPTPLPSGTVLRVKDADKDRIKLSIQSNAPDTSLSLLVHTRGSVKLAVQQALINGIAEWEIDKKLLGDGVSHITVFNAANNPVCERLYFKIPAALSIGLKTDAQLYGERKKVTVDLNTSDATFQPVEGDLSLSVFLLDSLQTVEQAGILSYLWLQSDLKGNIESPGYYFSSGEGVEEATDNLMLTQGWRRFQWEEVLIFKKNEPEYLPEIEGHLINGRIVDRRNGQPAANITGYLSVPAEKSLFAAAASSGSGAIRFNVKNFYGGNEVIVQTNGLTDSLYRIEIVSPFYEYFSTRSAPGLSILEKQSELLVSHSIQSQVGNTFYTAKQQQFLFPVAIDTMPFYGLPEKRYYLDDYTRFITMEEVMREYIADVRVRKNNNQFSYRVINNSFKDFFETAPLVLVDGVPVTNLDKIIAFDPLKIRRIDVVSRKFFQNNLIHDGIVNYSTYQGDLAGYPLDANALIVEYAGLQLQREFYSPVYETGIQRESRLPDFRNQLYWAPEIHTGKMGSRQLSFYTADLPGTYVIVVQGITAGGLAGSKTTTFTVTK